LHVTKSRRAAPFEDRNVHHLVISVAVLAAAIALAATGAHLF